MLNGHLNKITQITLSSISNDKMISTSLDRKIIIWDSFNANKISQYTFEHEVNCSVFVKFKYLRI